MSRPRKFEIIQCPKCGREYLPAEIYYPKHFFGKPKDIIRDVYDRILDYDDTSMDLLEEYTCDKCNTNFQVRAKLTFVVEETKLGDMESEYVAPLPTNSLFE